MNDVIIIGGNHHNLLGVVRAFGENNIKPYVIITNDNKYCFVKKSKYIKEYDIIEESEEKIYELLLKKYAGKKNKPVIIPTSDFSEYVIDEYYNELSKYFILPNINNEAGKINKYMNKYIQYQLAKENGIEMAKSWELDINTKTQIPSDVIIPCIIKPIVSAFGVKGDISICQNILDIKKTINKYMTLGYEKAIMQEYINFDEECGLNGCVCNKNIILPAILRKIRIYPKKQGNVSYGKLQKEDECKINLQKIYDLIQSINYSGMFDIEIFRKKDKIYLNEINFRNSGNSYVFTYGKVYIVYLWYLMATGKNIDIEQKEILKNYYFRDEALEFKQFISKNISLKEYLNSKKKSKISFIINYKDVKPFFYKFIYAILRRIH